MLINSMLSTLPLWFKKIVKQETYQSELEKYIVAHNPQSTYDVEKLTQEFDRRKTRGLW